MVGNADAICGGSQPIGVFSRAEKEMCEDLVSLEPTAVRLHRSLLADKDEAGGLTWDGNVEVEDHEVIGSEGKLPVRLAWHKALQGLIPVKDDVMLRSLT